MGLTDGFGQGKKRTVVLAALLIAIAVLGPLVAYAGISVVYPESTVTADVDTTPFITFAAGTDHSTANSLGIAGAFSTSDNGATFTVTINGLSGGKYVIDDITNITRESAVASYKMEISTALGAGIDPTTFKVRLWTGSTAPTADGDAQVCAVLDLESAQGTETTNSCSKSTKVQLIYELPSGQTTESDSVSIRPSSITFA